MRDQTARSQWPLRIGLVSLLVLSVALLAWLCWPVQSVRIDYPAHGCHWRTSTFQLQWRHSVEHQIWRDIYHVESHGLRLVRSEMQTFGAGAPSSGRPVPASPGFTGLAVNQAWPEIHWVVSRNMEGSLIANQLIWPIHTAVPDYTEITLSVDHTPRYRTLWGERCDDHFQALKPARPA